MEPSTDKPADPPMWPPDSQRRPGSHRQADDGCGDG
ncbi:hypothetical protein GA0070558_12921 [Micromonospora haikouensis]|uniref:Uncharacterized protein n=1 Tax=Micromonospora haikouensis TaxID=686309 RepID=A0A1C4XS51_9ACTN|nr:hypothetical protein GA0070558_12921 [Micromonospora haikouensis]